MKKNLVTDFLKKTKKIREQKKQRQEEERNLAEGSPHESYRAKLLTQK